MRSSKVVCIRGQQRNTPLFTMVSVLMTSVHICANKHEMVEACKCSFFLGGDYLYIYIYIHIHIYIYIVHSCIHLCIYLCIYSFMYLFISVFMYLFI